ncbi:hypothetical protein, partial [Escherichia coli]|uniref:hypothetical protein n=1 Tax=Escherichia coli TaxID=562 RepID=UPI0028830486
YQNGTVKHVLDVHKTPPLLKWLVKLYQASSSTASRTGRNYLNVQCERKKARYGRILKFTGIISI